MTFLSVPTEWPPEYWGAVLAVSVFALLRLTFYKKAKKAGKRQKTGRLIRRTTSWYEQE